MVALPTENVWIITDTTGTVANFTALKTVLRLPAATGREIKLEFPNIEAIPANAFYDSSVANITSLVSVSADKSITIGYLAFRYCESLKTVLLPKATSIGDRTFLDCRALTDMTIATGAGGLTINSLAFDDTPRVILQLLLMLIMRLNSGRHGWEFIVNP